MKKEHRYIDYHNFPSLEELSVLKINKWLQLITVEWNSCVLSENGLGLLSFFLEIVCVILQIFVLFSLLVCLLIKVANCKNKKGNLSCVSTGKTRFEVKNEKIFVWMIFTGLYFAFCF